MFANQTKGIINKNPGNIKYNPANQWVGQVGEGVGGFVKFDTFDNGIRAIGLLIKNYQKNGFQTIEQIINRYAPPEDDNPTSDYVEFVGYHGFIPSTLNEYTTVVERIIAFENGFSPFSFSFIKDSIREVVL